jgi:hypothetical protein
MEYADIVVAIADDNLEPRVRGIFVDSIGGENPVYVAEADENKVQFINSSNQEPLHNFDSILENISEAIQEDDWEGEVFDPMTGNQVWWEVVPLGVNGTLLK